MPAITSSAPWVDTIVTTGDTTATCASLANTSPTLIGMGAPVNPTMNDDPGGITITSAPIPAWRARVSLSMPIERPTISRISVTSSAIATTLISDRIGRCTRFATIILFIMKGRSTAYQASDFFSVLGIRNRLGTGYWQQGSVPISTLRSGRRVARLVQPHHLGAWRLLERELVIGQRLVQVELHHRQRDVVLL